MENSHTARRRALASHAVGVSGLKEKTLPPTASRGGHP
jgi:hypothetical protein